jgi:hypothetical protein
MSRLEFLAARADALPQPFARWVAARSEVEAALAPAPASFTRQDALTPVPHAAYAQTLAAYVAAVAPRARAVYQVGRVREDGLSDLDLIFVPGAPRFDDGQFYSARLRVPHARRLFPHDARPLPLGARDAIRFTSHADRRLVFGEDVLAGEAPARGPEQDLSLLLEGFLKYERFARGVAREGCTPAERMVSKATSLAYSLALFDRLCGESRAPAYAEASLALRAQLARPGAPRERLLATAWLLFAERLGALERALAKRLPLANGESLAEFAAAFLRGRRDVPGLDTARLAQRREAVQRYHAALARGGFFIGSLFAKGAYGASAGAARERRATLPRRALAKCVAAGYRLGAFVDA